MALADGGFLRRMPGPGIELDLVVPRDQAAQWRQRLVDAGVRPAGVWAYEAHRVAALRPRLGVDTDERTIPHEVGWIGTAPCTSTRAATAARKPSHASTTWANRPGCWCLLHLDGSTDRPATGDPVLAGGRTVGRLGTVVDHVDEGPIALALLKRGLPADTPLTTGGDTEVAAVIDAGLDAGRRRGRRGAAGGGTAARRSALTTAPIGPASAPTAGHGKVLAGQ